MANMNNMMLTCADPLLLPVLLNYSSNATVENLAIGQIDAIFSDFLHQVAFDGFFKSDSVFEDWLLEEPASSEDTTIMVCEAHSNEACSSLSR
jgi:hypothetical protein